MPNKHKNPMLAFHPDDPDLRARVEALAGKRGVSRKAVMEAAVLEYLDRHDTPEEHQS